MRKEEKIKEISDDLVEIITEEANTQTDASNQCVDLYLQEMGNIKTLDHAEEKNLALKIKNGDMQAYERMVTANLRLVVFIAKKFQRCGLPLEDLIQEGNIGLMLAAKRYNPDKGRFSTYATWWIRQSILRSLYNTGREVRLPVHIHERISQLRNARKVLRLKTGNEATEEELAKVLEWSVDEVTFLLNIIREPVSLDAIVSNDDKISLGDLVADTKNPSVEECYEEKEKKELLRKLISNLSDREQAILIMRFGLAGQTPMTLDAVGSELKLTRERIRQIEKRALLKLQTPACRDLKGYI